MTIIAVFKGPDGIFIGGDSMAADPDDTVYIADAKVFEFNGFTIGYAGSFRFGQVLQNTFHPPPHNPKLDDTTYMFSIWLETLRETLDSYGMLKTENGIDTIGEDGSALVVYRDNIYYIQEDLSVLRSGTPFAAIGVGMSYAIGALSALQDQGLPGELTLQKALDAAIKFSPRCGGQTTIIKHDPTTEVKYRKPRETKTVCE